MRQCIKQSAQQGTGKQNRHLNGAAVFIEIFVTRFLKLHPCTDRPAVGAFALQMHQMRLRLVYDAAAGFNDTAAEIGFFEKEEKTLVEILAAAAQTQ